ncbi:MAG: hypothetical protein VB124_02845 [Burkholderia sp.]
MYIGLASSSRSIYATTPWKTVRGARPTMDKVHGGTLGPAT